MTTKAASQQITYDDRFFNLNEAGSLASARVVVPIVLDLFSVKQVVDFGCGRGTWLRAFLEAGANDVLGIDGAYVDRSKLLIDPKCFISADLSQPVRLDRSFDLALCLEVAEHLPPRASSQLVQSLTAAAPAVLFSAAIPGQPGTDHINEWWPGFWRGLFADCGYQRFDLIRPSIWRNRHVEWWYRQNIYLFASGAVLEMLMARELVAEEIQYADLDLISYRILERYQTLSGLLCEIPRAVARSIRVRTMNRRVRKSSSR